MKTIILISLMALNVTAAEKTLSCSITSSWNHETNFTTVEENTHKWEGVPGAIDTYIAQLKLASSDGNIKTTVSTTRTNSELEILIVNHDVTRNYKTSAFTQQKSISTSVLYPVERAFDSQAVNQVDVECHVN